MDRGGVLVVDTAMLYMYRVLGLRGGNERQREMSLRVFSP